MPVLVLDKDAEYVLEVSNKHGSACVRIIKVQKGVHTVVAQTTIPTGETKSLTDGRSYCLTSSKFTDLFHE